MTFTSVVWSLLLSLMVTYFESWVAEIWKHADIIIKMSSRTHFCYNFDTLQTLLQRSVTGQHIQSVSNDTYSCLLWWRHGWITNKWISGKLAGLSMLQPHLMQSLVITTITKNVRLVERPCAKIWHTANLTVAVRGKEFHESYFWEWCTHRSQMWQHVWIVTVFPFDQINWKRGKWLLLLQKCSFHEADLVKHGHRCFM